MIGNYYRRWFFFLFVFAEGTGTSENTIVNEYNPWPYFNYTGKLRPSAQTPIRTVPDHIGRPDYADHPQGRSLSEEGFRGLFQRGQK